MLWNRISFGIKIVLAVFLFAGVLWMLTSVLSNKDRLAAVLIGSRVFKLEIAATPLLMERGLAGRTNLARNGGMLFLFSKHGQHSFWMKGTLIPIDII